MTRNPNTQYILSLSYGKDSLACIEAIRQLGLPLDRIVHAEVWATDTISADLPPMVEFKAKADKIIKERYGIDVEHICAMKDGEKLTYEKIFYRVPKRRNPPPERDRQSTDLQQSEFHTAIRSSNEERYWIRYGFPRRKMPFCQSGLKRDVLDRYIRISNFNRQRKLVYSTQAESFPLAPLNRGRR